jgi:hypothetical protein
MELLKYYTNRFGFTLNGIKMKAFPTKPIQDLSIHDNIITFIYDNIRYELDSLNGTLRAVIKNSALSSTIALISKDQSRYVVL